MAGLQRSVETFRRSGSSGLVWDERFFVKNTEKLQKEERRRSEAVGPVGDEFRELQSSQSMNTRARVMPGFGLPPPSSSSKSLGYRVMKFVRKSMSVKQTKVSSY